MIPLRDDVPSRTFPFVTLALIAANIAAFWYEVTLGRKLARFFMVYGLVPVRFLNVGLDNFPGPEGLWVSPLTSIFLHGGLMHLVSNMWTLWIFGDNVEDRLGHARFLAFYVLSGLAAGAAQVAAGWGSPVPVVGASGAIAGVMGAYFLLFPYARVHTLVPVFVFLYRTELPAFLFLAVWFLSQLYFGSFGGQASGVAWWAHIGGFVAGMALLRALLKG
ncbi:MAG: rhomboid family intramembrane serine protease, partial [Elusimicrobia bacterium]|nr:rhomboid family intramembrane serine protease [Elusimicrobiota bacterium]